jgi:hypothetical protein
MEPEWAELLRCRDEAWAGMVPLFFLCPATAIFFQPQRQQ